jgi:homoprotocatechuate degradation regulator HpaR
MALVKVTNRTLDADMVALPKKMLPYRHSLAGVLLAARESVMDPIRPILREVNVTEQQWRVLRVLHDSGFLDPTTLAEAALLFAPSVTRILQDLTERGLVVRQRDAGDKRRSIISLTKSGENLLTQTVKRTLPILNSYEVRFGAARLQHLREELEALTNAISNTFKEREELQLKRNSNLPNFRSALRRRAAE